jgi:hypothetical protein
MADDKEIRRHEIEIEIESLNIQMKAKRFDRYSNEEKMQFIQKQIDLFTELKSLAGFMYHININTMISILSTALKKIK